MLGNGLRELDRFLNLLLDEVAALCCADEDRRRIARLRNTSRKYAEVCARLDRPMTAMARLRAIGRCRDCLFHCGGIVRRPDARGGAGMAAGWPMRGGGPATIALGSTLPVSAGDLASVCRFYRAIAVELRAATHRLAPVSTAQADRRGNRSGLHVANMAPRHC